MLVDVGNGSLKVIETLVNVRKGIATSMAGRWCGCACTGNLKWRDEVQFHTSGQYGTALFKEAKVGVTSRWVIRSSFANVEVWIFIMKLLCLL